MEKKAKGNILANTKILNDKTYQDWKKSKFINKLANAFEQFKSQMVTSALAGLIATLHPCPAAFASITCCWD